jgi:hypothetical protein
LLTWLEFRTLCLRNIFLMRILALVSVALAIAESGAISASVIAPTSVLTMPFAMVKALRLV